MFRYRADSRARSIGQRPSRRTVRSWAVCGRGNCRDISEHTCRIRIWAGNPAVGRKPCDLRSYRLGPAIRRCQTLRKGLLKLKSKNMWTVMNARFYRVEFAVDQKLTGQ